MQQWRNIFVIFFAFCAVSAVAFALTPDFYQKRTLTIAADSWCPINCARSQGRLGVGIDLAKAIFEPLGYTIDYRLMPWSEALARVRSGQVDAVIGASRYDDASLVFPRQPVYNITDDFYVLKGNSWRFQGVHTLKAKKIGVIADYGYGNAINEYIRNNSDHVNAVQFATGENALRDNIKKLLSNQIEVIVETRPVMEYTILKMKLGDKIAWAGSSPQAEVFLAFSPASEASRGLAAQFDVGMQQFGASGRLEGFYSAYGLQVRDRTR